MAALSLRLDPELEMRLTQEVRRRNTTKTEFVQSLLRQALEPRDPVDLLYVVRSEHGLPDPRPDAPDVTEQSRQVKAPFMAQRSNSTSRTPSVAPGNAARCSSISCCRSVWTPNTWPKTAAASAH